MGRQAVGIAILTEKLYNIIIMTGEVFRTFQLSGELLPEHWRTLNKTLGSMGLSLTEVIPPGSLGDSLLLEHPEFDEQPILATRTDFLQYADENSIDRRTAGRAWYCLVREFSYKINPNYYTESSFYEQSKADSFPVSFHVYPSLEKWDYNSEDKITDLDVHSLKTLVTKLDRLSERRDVKGALESVLCWSRQVGPVVVSFWRDFVTAKLPAVDS